MEWLSYVGIGAGVFLFLLMAQKVYASSVGNALNVAWGFEVADSSIITIGGTSVGLLDGAITVRVPRTVNFLRADQYASPLDSSVITKDVFVSFTMKEVLGDSFEYAWGTGAYATSTINVDATDQGQVALVINTKGPDGSTVTCTLAKTVSTGEGTWTLPFADGQSIEAEYQAVGDLAASGKMLALVHS